jgi:hypothetical protein
MVITTPKRSAQRNAPSVVYTIALGNAVSYPVSILGAVLGGLGLVLILFSISSR